MKKKKSIGFGIFTACLVAAIFFLVPDAACLFDMEVFAETIYDTAHGELGNNYSKYAREGVAWCGFYVRSVLNESYAQLGLDYQKYVPAEALPGACNIAKAYESGEWGEYYSFTEWQYKDFYGKISDNLDDFSPKPGDIALVEDRNTLWDGPDHIALIIKVNEDGSFVTSEGNTGPGTKETTTVREYTYRKVNGIFQREEEPEYKVHMVCAVKVPA